MARAGPAGAGAIRLAGVCGAGRIPRMSIGSLIRRVLGPRVFQHVGRAYRRIFVDVRKTAQVLAEIIPPGAHVVDIGGGDGEPLNCLLRLRDDITVTMIDISPIVGWMIEESLLGRVERLAGTSIRQYLQLGPRAIQAAVVSDVLHHVPAGQREAFLADLRELLAQGGCNLLAVKEFAPHGLRGRLGYLADRYNRWALMFSGYVVSGIAWVLYGTVHNLTLFLVISVMEGLAVAWSYPANHRMTQSNSSLVRPLRSTLLTYAGYTLAKGIAKIRCSVIGALLEFVAVLRERSRVRQTLSNCE